MPIVQVIFEAAYMGVPFNNGTQLIDLFRASKTSLTQMLLTIVISRSISFLGFSTKVIVQDGLD